MHIIMYESRPSCIPYMYIHCYIYSLSWRFTSIWHSKRVRKHLQFLPLHNSINVRWNSIWNYKQLPCQNYNQYWHILLSLIVFSDDYFTFSNKFSFEEIGLVKSEERTYTYLNTVFMKMKKSWKHWKICTWY